MDDYQDYSDYGEYDSSGGDVFDEEDDEYDDEPYGGEDDDEEEGEEEVLEVEELNEEGDPEEEEEEEDAEDEMEDYEEEEEITEIGEQFADDEEIVGDQGVEIEDEAEEDLVEYEVEEEDEEEELMEEEEELFEEEEEEEEEEDLLEEEEDELDGDEGYYEDDVDYENEITAGEPIYSRRWTARAPVPAISTPLEYPRRRLHNFESGFSDLSEDRGGLGRSDGTASSRETEVVASREIESGGSNDSSLAGIQGTNCSICFERWTGEGGHCVCCLPCGHLYGLSCIKMWLQRPNSQKCPQCNDFCELADVRRLYGLQLAISGVEELQQKVKCLEAKCASLELKDTEWLRKEASWQKREADLQEQLDQHKAKTELLKDIRERRDPADDTGPVNALRHMKL